MLRDIKIKVNNGNDKLYVSDKIVIFNFDKIMKRLFQLSQNRSETRT